MKFIQTICLLIGMVSLNACQNDNCDGAPEFAQCQESPENNPTACQAVWQSWIYNEETGDCSKRSYSGCEPLGFETKEECEECDCYRLENDK
ncbi:MAG: BPTI/Kunitz-type proteinase inhibitor domain-containing protein [Bacteroidia bacterium]